MESMNIILPKEVANMQLPDPQLRNFYADLSNRSFWIDDEINEYLLELIKYIVDQFAEDKENVSYDVTEKDRAIEVSISLSPSDMGKVIGRQGKIAKARLTIVRAATPAGSKRYVIEIREKGGDKTDKDDEE